MKNELNFKQYFSSELNRNWNFAENIINSKQNDKLQDVNVIFKAKISFTPRREKFKQIILENNNRDIDWHTNWMLKQKAEPKAKNRDKYSVNNFFTHKSLIIYSEIIWQEYKSKSISESIYSCISHPFPQHSTPIQI